jgi:hypothetical protein
LCAGAAWCYAGHNITGEPEDKAERAFGADPRNLIRVMPAEGDMQSLRTPIVASRKLPEYAFVSPRPRIPTRGGLECCKTASVRLAGQERP